MRKFFNEKWLIIFDLLLFILPCLLFNLIDISKFQASPLGGLINLYLVFLLWVTLTSFRLLLTLLCTFKKIKAINLIVMSFSWLILLSFYALCLIGLMSWGKIPTLDMVIVYSRQLEVLIQTLDLRSLLIFLLLIVIVLIWCLYRLIWCKILWLYSITHRMHKITSFFMFFCLILISCISFWQNLYYSFTIKDEVFLEFLLPERSSKAIQDWRINSSKILESQEINSRLQYKKNTNYYPRNVIIIVVDALRADHLSVNQYYRKTTPFIDSLNESGTLRSITPVRSVCAESTCGLLALARSKYPFAVTNVDFSLYELLKQYGYTNYFILSGDHTNFYQMKDAYTPRDLYIDGSSVEQRFGVYANDDQAVLSALKKVPDFQKKPTFFQFHLMSVHGLGLRFKQNFPYSPAKNYYNRFGLGFSDKQALAINYYDNGVYQADNVIANIFSLLNKKGYLDNAIVVITGDHGDLLGEKGLYSHAQTIEDPVLNIPFVIWSSKKSDPALDFKNWGIVSQVDIAPTILQALNIPIPSSWQGVALQAAPKTRSVFVSQGKDVGVYTDYNKVIFKLTLDKETSTERSFMLDRNSLELKEPLNMPPNLLKNMRRQLYSLGM